MPIKKKRSTEQQTPELINSSELNNSSESDRRLWALALSVAAITFLVYLPTLANGFVSWDDMTYIVKNTQIQEPGALWRVFLPMETPHWYPLTFFTFAIEYRLWGLNPLGYHLVNNILHSLNVLLIFFLTIRLIKIAVKNYSSAGSVFSNQRSVIIAASVTALFFGIHPTHVESVAWATERKDVLSTLFFLTSIISYLKYTTTQERKKYYYAISITACLLALMSKSMAVSLPIVLLLLDYYPTKRLFITGKLRLNVLVEKIPYLSLAALSALVTITSHKSAEIVHSFELFPLTERIFVSMHSYIRYLYKLLLPIELVPLYPNPAQIDILTLKYLAPPVILIFITWLCLRKIRTNPAPATLWLCYLLTLAPVIGIIRFATQTFADRFVYIPSITMHMAVGIAAAILYERYNNTTIRRALIIFGTSIVIILSAKTITQIPVWKSSLTLWSHQIERYPKDRHPGYFTRANVYKKQGQLELALRDYNSAIEVYPSYSKAFNNRGLLYIKLERFDDALSDFSSSISSDPNKTEPYTNRAVMYINSGKIKEAIKDLDKAIELDPENTRAAELRSSIKTQPPTSNSAEDYNLKALKYARNSNYYEAIKSFTMAVKLDPAYARAYYNRAITYAGLDKMDLAIADYKKAIELKPDYAKAHYNLGRLYLAVNKGVLARESLGKASALGHEDAGSLLETLEARDK
jgi:tetratricopeptide (TPR) repeat protein